MERDSRRQPESGELIAFLRGQRWFGSKSDVRDARVAEHIALPWAGGAFAIALVEVTSDAGTSLYQVPLVTGESPIRDATAEPAFQRGLANALANGESIASEAGTKWIVEPFGEQRLIFPADTTIRRSDAEQSNTSIVFGREAILKLFRRLEAGPQPDVEVTTFLTAEARFPHTPVVLATIRLESPSGEVTVAGVVQEYVANARDGWAFALEQGRLAFEAPDTPDTSDAERPFVAEAARIGSMTREMHQALARGTSPEFLPDSAIHQDVRGWCQTASDTARKAFDLLDRVRGSSLDGARHAEAEVLLSRRADYTGLMEELTSQIAGDGGLRIRIHGDYHLGQLLATASRDFVVIDFEGEPTRSLAERRRKESPLRDVAGMLRSFAYAAAVVKDEGANPGASAGGRSRPARKAGDDRMAGARREVAAGRWERAVREAFLAAYFTEPAAGARILPESGDNVRRLLSLFEAEKAFYELAYELNHRPAWAWIPMRGISRLLVEPLANR